MDSIGNVDSKYRFVILASKRAKQLLKGAKPKLKAKSRNLIRIAQSEVKSGLVEYQILPTHQDDIPEQDERMFVGADIGVEDIGEPDTAPGKELAEEEAVKEGEEESAEENEEGGDEELAEDEVENGLKEDKDE